MKYLIMCGGKYEGWEKPRQLVEINGEPIVARTIRLLRENGVYDIAISSNDERFDVFGVPRVTHKNNYNTADAMGSDACWVDGFYSTTNEPICYLFGDVVFSEEAIKTIVQTETKDFELFASAPPFDERYIKEWAEPFGIKVVASDDFRYGISLCKFFEKQGRFNRRPIAWELWQILKHTPLNEVDYTNYTIINDWTCDIDEPEDIKLIERYVK